VLTIPIGTDPLKGETTMFTTNKLLRVLLSLAVLLGSALLSPPFVKAAPLHQEESETPSMPDAGIQIFLPLVSVDDAIEDPELETEQGPTAPEVTQASIVCQLTARAGIYAFVEPNGSPVDYIYTAAAGRGFRAYLRTLYVDKQGRYWYYGHSAEKPTTNGYVWINRVRC
jgi:hypothetical protein